MQKSQPARRAFSPAERADLVRLILQEAKTNPVEFADIIDVPGRPVSGAEGEDSAQPDEDFAPIESNLARHHRLILEAMEDVSRTRHGRLMIFAPPGSAKSSYASVVFPAHYLGREPDRRVILASYGDDLARKMGRRTRAIIRQPLYTSIFGAALSGDSAAAQEFALTNGSEYLAAGILSGVTGNRAHGIVIDDPVKGREQANSDAVSEKTWAAYNDDLKTRLIPGGWAVLIQTRWSEKDLAGRILPEDWKGDSGVFDCRDGQRWRVLCLQARCDTDTDPLGRARGEYLWPEWFDAGHWKQFESQPITWPSLYQQIPSPLEGALFRPDRIPVIDALPMDAGDFVRGWDMASVTDSGDWTAGVKIGRLADGRFVIADMVRVQEGPDQRDATMIATAKRDGGSTKIGIPQDPGQAGKTQVAYLARRFQGFKIRTSPETGDKVTRAEPFAAQVNVGNVVMLRGPWNDALINEMRVFPNGRNDDQIDACSRAFGELVAKRTSFFG